MGRSKQSKNYDIYISPGKRYLYRTRKILFVLSVLTFVLNMSIIAVFDTLMRKDTLISLALSLLFGIIQLVDNRKANWEWHYIIILCAVLHFFSAISVFSADLLFMRYIWVGELILFSGFIGLSLYKNKKR